MIDLTIWTSPSLIAHTTIPTINHSIHSNHYSEVFASSHWPTFITFLASWAIQPFHPFQPFKAFQPRHIFQSMQLVHLLHEPFQTSIFRSTITLPKQVEHADHSSQSNRSIRANHGNIYASNTCCIPPNHSIFPNCNYAILPTNPIWNSFLSKHTNHSIRLSIPCIPTPTTDCIPSTHVAPTLAGHSAHAAAYAAAVLPLVLFLDVL